MNPNQKASDFLKIAEQFKLGHLQTESFHPLTHDLSSVVKSDLTQALSLLQEVDKQALTLMKGKAKVIWEMSESIQETLRLGNKVYLCGCGATGRLSLVLETLYRQQKINNQVISFMAGGDYALIKSVESFEDRTEYGQRQLVELGFGPNDLLLASTEGGETPFVIGAVNAAAQISQIPPYFLYCNPDELLIGIERSREVIKNLKIKKINLSVGPMAISGSTRMQASTVLMLAIGSALLYQHASEDSFTQCYLKFIDTLLELDYKKLAPLTKKEAEVYQNKKYINYLAPSDYAISILTDTTERSPTFSLRGFENRLDKDPGSSLSYLFVKNAESSSEAWSELLWRSPRALEWQELNHKVDLIKLYGFDISMSGLRHREKRLACERFLIEHRGAEIYFNCAQEILAIKASDGPLLNHLIIKVLLNAHSTLVMGILGRYEGNVMTWVKASNYKLIDRASRYILQILKLKKIDANYDQVVHKIFETIEKTDDKTPVVLKVVSQFS